MCNYKPALKAVNGGGIKGFSGYKVACASHGIELKCIGNKVTMVA